MGFHVSSAVGHLSKSLATERAQKWFLTSVNAHMIMEVVNVTKSVSAQCTFKRFLTSVSSNVPDNFRIPAKHFLADMTLKLFAIICLDHGVTVIGHFT